MTKKQPFIVDNDLGPGIRSYPLADARTIARSSNSNPIIITKRFNRSKVAQNYEYDHRSLAEVVDQIEFEPDVEARLGEAGK